jgi:hypothetical protein
MSFGIVAAAATVGSALVGARSASKAADAQAGATRGAVGEQRRQYEQTREDFLPWREAGQRALGSLEADISRMPTAQEVMSDPGYQFGLNQGEQAINRRLAASGGRISGGALKAATRFGADYAASGYGAAYQRRQDRLNRLAALAGIGQTATGAGAAAGQNRANAVSALVSSQGDANAASQLQRGSIWGNTGNQLAALYGQYKQPAAVQPDPYAGGWTGEH